MVGFLVEALNYTWIVALFCLNKQLIEIELEINVLSKAAIMV